MVKILQIQCANIHYHALTEKSRELWWIPYCQNFDHSYVGEGRQFRLSQISQRKKKERENEKGQMSSKD